MRIEFLFPLTDEAVAFGVTNGKKMNPSLITVASTTFFTYYNMITLDPFHIE